MKFLKDKIFVILLVIACVLNTLPVMLNTFIISLDGPSHLYNANLIAALINGNGAVQDFVSINNYFTNWFGHFLLILFNLVVPAWIAQKILLILLVVAIPAAFAFMVCRINYSSRYLSFIIFPFSYSTFFFLGFYNFLLAVVFFFLWMAFVYKENRTYSRKEKVFIFVLFLLMECSHIFVFMIALGMFAWFLAAPVLQKNKFHVKSLLRDMLLPLKTFFSVTSGGLLLLAAYFLGSDRHQFEKPQNDTPWSKIIADIYEIHPLQGLSNDYHVLTTVLFVVFVGILLFIVIRALIARKNKTSYFLMYNALLLLVLYVITLFFLDKGLYIQSRLLFLFFLLWWTWIAIQKIPKLVQIVLIVYSLAVSTVFMSYYMKMLPYLSLRCYYAYDAGQKIEKNSRVFCVNYSSHWLENHLLNYLGAENTLVMYNNYECEQNFFPLKWKHPETVRSVWNEYYSGNFSEVFYSNVDYVAILQENQHPSYPNDLQFLSMIREHYAWVMTSFDEGISIYKKIPKKMIR